MTDFMKKPCPQCPFRSDVKPFLTPERGEELAYAAQHRYQGFPCHKTTESDDDGDHVYTTKEKECAGYLTLKAQELGEESVAFFKGFIPSYDIVYVESYEMAEAYDP
jgi:hypothetical protein